MSTLLPDVMSWELTGPWLALALVVGYLIGSVPSGVIIARVMNLGDLRAIGSGNIGATNVLRTGNKAAAALTLVLDMVKGLLPVLLFFQWGDLAAQAAGIGAVLGHCLPIWLWFKGGKGVATFIGVILGLYWLAGLLVCATWLAGSAVTRRSSVGSLACAASAPIWLWILTRPEAVLTAAALAIWIWVRHHQNIGRLLTGEEPKIGAKRT